MAQIKDSTGGRKATLQERLEALRETLAQIRVHEDAAAAGSQTPADRRQPPKPEVDTEAVAETEDDAEALPLNADERAELESLRAEAARDAAICRCTAEWDCTKGTSRRIRQHLVSPFLPPSLLPSFPISSSILSTHSRADAADTPI